MVIRKVFSKLPGENIGFGMTREFDNLKFTIVTYFCFGTFFMVLMGKIGDLQAQIRSVEIEVRFNCLKSVKLIELTRVFLRAENRPKSYR